MTSLLTAYIICRQRLMWIWSVSTMRKKKPMCSRFNMELRVSILKRKSPFLYQVLLRNKVFHNNMILWIALVIWLSTLAADYLPKHTRCPIFIKYLIIHALMSDLTRYTLNLSKLSQYVLRIHLAKQAYNATISSLTILCCRQSHGQLC